MDSSTKGLALNQMIQQKTMNIILFCFFLSCKYWVILFYFIDATDVPKDFANGCCVGILSLCASDIILETLETVQNFSNIHLECFSDINY